jgi:hypothetical protein
VELKVVEIPKLGLRSDRGGIEIELFVSLYNSSLEPERRRGVRNKFCFGVWSEE